MSAYRAVLYGNQVRWIDTPPKRTRPTEIQVIFRGEGIRALPAERGPAMAAALEKLARAGTFAALADPIAWQRETRQDRTLPGRTP